MFYQVQHNNTRRMMMVINGGLMDTDRLVHCTHPTCMESISMDTIIQAVHAIGKASQCKAF